MNKQTQDLLGMSDMCIFMLMYEYYPYDRRNKVKQEKMENQHP